MILTFCLNSSDPRKAVKNITQIHQVQDAKIYRECSLMTPEFLVNYSYEIIQCNYVIAGITSGEHTAHARYFIKDKIVMPGGKVVIICAKDVLSTWWELLKECTANVIRQESEDHFKNNSKYIFDRKMVGKVNTDFGNIGFSENPFHLPTQSNEYCMLMTVLGGTQQTPPSSGNQLQSEVIDSET